MNGIPVCRICVEPITNFICPSCLYRAMQQWIWKYQPELVEKFMGFHESFISTVVSDRTAFCVACKMEYYHMVCAFDYMKSVHEWLEEQGVSQARLKEFVRIFGMGLRSIQNGKKHLAGHPHNGNAVVDIGFCENCENFSDALRPDAAGRMVCERCG